ncbi:MAG: glycogen-binding domain-containing protein [Gemmatimonadales bacterium]
MRLSRFAAVIALLALPYRVARAQDARLLQRFDTDAARRLQLVIDSAARDTLPTEPLVERALEGSAKGAPFDRIVTALDALRVALLTARQSLGPRATATELSTGASALQAGVPAVRLVELRRLRGDKPVTAPLGAYLDLVARGATPDRAWDHITELARRQASDAAYRKLTPVIVDRPPPPDAPDDAPDWQLTTINGRGQLDRSRATSLAALNGSISQTIGPVHADVAGATVDHVGIGTTGSVGADVVFRTSIDRWRVAAGGVASSGREINEAWTNAGGGMIAARRDLGRWSLSSDLRGGLAQRGTFRTPWITHTAGAAFDIGPFRLSALWRGNIVADSVRDLHVFGDTLPRDSMHLSGPPVYVSDTGWKHVHRDIHDVAFAASWSRGLLAVSGQFGRRFGDSARAESWFLASAALQLTPTIAVVASGGRTTADLLLGLRGGQTATLGLRLSTGRHSRDDAAGVPMHELELVSGARNTIRLIFVIPGVRDHVLLGTDLSGWVPMALRRRDDGRWEVAVPAGPGAHRFNLQVDDGAWRAPPGMTVIDDGFGGKVGVLVFGN